MTGRGLRWAAFAALAGAVLLVLGLTGQEIARLERAEVQARAEAEYHEAVRLALWRCDSWISPRLAREAGRPYFEYLSFYPPDRAYTRVLGRIRPGEIITPSPLLTERDPIIRLHFQVRADGSVTSPQVPRGNELDLAQASLVDAAEIAARERDLTALEAILPPVAMLMALCEPEAQSKALATADAGARAGEQLPQDDGAYGADNEQLNRSLRESTRRNQAIAAQSAWVDARRPAGASNALNAELAAAAKREGTGDFDAGPSVWVGPFDAVWIEGSAASTIGPTLVLLRMVEAEGDRLVQGVALDWEKMQSELVAQVSDLLPDAVLVPDVAGTDAGAAPRRLAGVPVRLEAAMPVVSAAAGPGVAGWLSAPLGRTLLVAWVLAVGALVAVAFTLRTSFAWADRRERFASAVTHELRTPLTTFRMYAEMLDEGMVHGESKRAEYIHTLRTESDRLGELVENVLAYARIERGHGDGPVPAQMTVGELAGRVLPEAERRAGRLGLAVNIAGPDAASAERTLSADPDAVGQVLANLLDNAAKYGRDPAAAVDALVVVDIHLQSAGDGIVLDVRDHGPGIAAGERGLVFRPFRRGGEEVARGQRGVGLGLALGRELMRRQGGDLTLVGPADGGPGACFRVRFGRT